MTRSDSQSANSSAFENKGCEIFHIKNIDENKNNRRA